MSLKRSLFFGAAILIAVLSVATLPAAGSPTVAAPEIDGATLSNGLGLLTAGVLLLRASRRK